MSKKEYRRFIRPFIPTLVEVDGQWYDLDDILKFVVANCDIKPVACLKKDAQEIRGKYKGKGISSEEFISQRQEETPNE